MRKSSWLQSLLAIAALSTSAAFANAPIPAPTADDAIRQVQERKVAEYRQVLATFDAAMQSAPKDADIAVARCRFIAAFTDDEYGDWVESAPDDFHACQEMLQSQWGEEPVAQLFALEQLWGTQAVEQGEKLLENAAAWPAPLRRALLAKVSEVQEDEDNTARAGELAAQAARLGESGRVALAVEYLVTQEDFDEAARLLATAPPAVDAWRARARVEAALKLPDTRAALKELQRYARSGWEINTAVAARAYLRAGEVSTARKLLKDEDGDTDVLQKVRFETALAAKDYAAAAAMVRFTEARNFSDNLQRFVELAKVSPASLARPPMLLGLLVCALMVLALALVPGVLLLPVHYRGLMRRVRGKPAVPVFEGVGLSRAWWAAAVFLVVPSLFGLLVEPEAIAMIVGEDMPAGKVVFRMMAWGTLAGLLFVLPGARALGMRQLLGDRTSWRASWRIPVAWACLFTVGALIGWWHQHSGGGGETVQTKTVAALVDGGAEAYGTWSTFLLVALLVPVFEELVFRGLVLGGLTRHISFGWANMWQALLFAVAHDDPPRFAFYFAMGLLGGWLVKRTNALGPAIALHILNNALAVALRQFS